ncbi:unnamed protein product [Strongylus vulgaris]|uniref:Uncharacterized protein n=1 Tax=Strongylus vulgaris TaxID=40348 RepID=A0A3P7K8Z5_STRVU|nr:unnamed protein product [Strongylus vulgaris]
MSRHSDPAETSIRQNIIGPSHVMRKTDDKWTLRFLDWNPRDAKRLEGGHGAGGFTFSLQTSKGSSANVAAAVLYRG